MSKQKDELITGSELAKRLDVNRSYITNNKSKLKDAKCTYGNKYYYKKSCDYLGKDPKDPHKSRQSNLQTDIKRPIANETTRKQMGISKKEERSIISEINNGLDEIDDTKKRMAQCQTNNDDSDSDNSNNEAKELLEQILLSVKGGNGIENRIKIDILKQKAGLLREYFTAKNEEIKNRKLEDNLFERDEVIRILSFAMNMIRNSIINLPNNYAVSLEGLSQKEIKDFVTDDTNKILEDLQNIGNQFDD